MRKKVWRAQLLREMELASHDLQDSLRQIIAEVSALVHAVHSISYALHAIEKPVTLKTLV